MKCMLFVLVFGTHPVETNLNLDCPPEIPPYDTLALSV